MKLTFAGSGDAFGSGGRFNTCFHIKTSETCFLIDCGSTSLVALNRLDIDLNAIDTILITHFHGDHFGGIPYFVLDAQFLSKRKTPLTIAGPPGLKDWYHKIMEATFAGSTKPKLKFILNLIELPSNQTIPLTGFEVEAQHVVHGQPDQAFYGYRITAENKVIGYSGDTEWTDALINIGENADIFIAEAYFYEKRVPYHLDFKTLQSKLPKINPKRLILTHMSSDMLKQIVDIQYDSASDGLVIEI